MHSYVSKCARESNPRCTKQWGCVLHTGTTPHCVLFEFSLVFANQYTAHVVVCWLANKFFFDTDSDKDARLECYSQSGASAARLASAATSSFAS